MKNTYTYQLQDQTIAIQGFIAALLEQGEKWDLRCIEADMQDYHQEHYARMDSIEALKQEFGWWLDFYTDERLDNIPQCDDLMKAGVSYLLWRVHQSIEDLTTTCKASRSVSLDAYWCKGIKQHLIPAAIRGLKKAVAKPNPAKALAEWVMQKQKAGILIQDIKPYTRFVAAVNKVCGTRIKSDTLSKHFRED